MIKVLLLSILLFTGIVLGPLIAGHQGYVLIQTDNYNIETSVTGLVIIIDVYRVVYHRMGNPPAVFDRSSAYPPLVSRP